MAAKTVVGLEITEESVRAVEVTTGHTPTLVAFGEVPLPDGAARDSEILDGGAVALALQQLWAQSGIKSRRVTLGVGSRRILVREYVAPMMSLENIKAALPYQVQDMLPVPANQAVLDFYPIDQDDLGVHGLLVAAVSETIEELIETLKKAKIHVDSVDLVPFGLARASKLVGRPGEATAMVHVGDHTTHLVVAIDGVPRFVRIIPAEVATTATERESTVEILEREPVEVALVTERDGRATLRTSRAQATLEADAAASVADLAIRLRSTLDFYAARPGAAMIGGVHVSGAGAANRTLLARLESALDRSVSVVEVGSIVATRGPAVEGELALNLVATVGVTFGEVK